MLKKYFYQKLFRYISHYCTSENSLLEYAPKNSIIETLFKGKYEKISTVNESKKINSDFVLINGNLHYEDDIQKFFSSLHSKLNPNARVAIIYYNSLWWPIFKLADKLGIRSTTPEQNWISHEDVANFLILEDYELIRVEQRILLPLYIPFLSNFLNRYLAPLPFFRNFTVLNIAIARPIFKQEAKQKQPSVSIVVAARNEAGNIFDIPKRIPKMGPNDELILVEGNSTDNTWATILELKKVYKGHLKIQTAQQDGKGKGDAVRKGFAMAKNEILMILDADLTVPPEDLPKFYTAIASGKGEFINGSRLVYPMEKKAMRFFNRVGNKFFAVSFSFVLGQRFKDTLCGTKVISKSNYAMLAKNRGYFGEFDPFGDFDLIFGASRMGLKIIEVPISYKERTYGETNISRWKHGVILLTMLLFAARKTKFI
ncbi:glycosyltransferase family 2 protein [Leptospira jelokensis]|uniref:glycosyltransferase family 2 protein n=1 Tax=Leptospira jelokensis TaxID=2484931 RepID=UPI0010915FC9|nr:glycosyltransferase family 2 protein [Leptospira jelokensis]TGL99188.1 glycosyltransferase family 2 protein [Leptospira jelokensis]